MEPPNRIVADQNQFDALMKSLTNIKPTDEGLELIERLRTEGKSLGLAIMKSCPASRERSLAITHLEETVMWAVKSIVLEGS